MSRMYEALRTIGIHARMTGRLTRVVCRVWMVLGFAISHLRDPGKVTTPANPTSFFGGISPLHSQQERRGMGVREKKEKHKRMVRPVWHFWFQPNTVCCYNNDATIVPRIS